MILAGVTGADGDIVVEELVDPGITGVREMLVDLALEEQDRYDHPRQSREQVEHGLPPVRATFTGENHVFAARDAAGAIVGLCWCVLFDPGTGLEGEVAEVFVAEGHRGKGIGEAMVRRAIDLFRERGVTLGYVWTREENEAAVRLYRGAGFEPPTQLVLTWYPPG